MFPVSWPLLVIFLLTHALAGMAIGALTGWLVCLIAKVRPKALVADGVLGIFGYFAGFAGCVLVWLKNTISYGIGPNPQWAAVLVAALLPLLNEVYRRKARRTTSLS
jgi:hypothetical protein